VWFVLTRSIPPPCWCPPICSPLVPRLATCSTKTSAHGSTDSNYSQQLNFQLKVYSCQYQHRANKNNVSNCILHVRNDINEPNTTNTQYETIRKSYETATLIQTLACQILCFRLAAKTFIKYVKMINEQSQQTCSFIDCNLLFSKPDENDIGEQHKYVGKWNATECTKHCPWSIRIKQETSYCHSDSSTWMKRSEQQWNRKRRSSNVHVCFSVNMSVNSIP
jgi:hypothetical protein